MSFKIISYFVRFYSHNSSLLHGGGDIGDKETEAVYGQQDIHKKIMELNFRDCRTKIRQVPLFNYLFNTSDHNINNDYLIRWSLKPHWSMAWWFKFLENFPMMGIQCVILSKHSSSHPKLPSSTTSKMTFFATRTIWLTVWGWQTPATPVGTMEGPPPVELGWKNLWSHLPHNA